MEFFTSNASWIGLIVSFIGIGFALYIRQWILKQENGTDKILHIDTSIQRGARALLLNE